MQVTGLRNNNPRGNPNAAPRCMARTRQGTPCKSPAMKGEKRCRMHGGKSSGPTTEEGKIRARKANMKHGHYTAEAIELRQLLRQIIKEGKELVDEM